MGFSYGEGEDEVTGGKENNNGARATGRRRKKAQGKKKKKKSHVRKGQASGRKEREKKVNK